MLLASSSITLSSYIISFAAAAKTAQAIMSTSEDPMVIKEFRFKANITADFSIETGTEVTLNIWRINLTQKLSTSYKESIGFEIECTLQPAWVISGGYGEKKSE